MPRIINPNAYTITAGGATVLLPVTDPTDLYQILPDSGAVTLVANQTFGPTGTPLEGMRYELEYGGGVTLDGNTLDIFGFIFSPNEALAKYIITATFTNGAFEVKLAYSANNGSATVDGANIQSGTIPGSALLSGDTPLTSIVPLSGEGIQLKSNALGVLIEHDATQAGEITIGDGTTVNPRFMSGAILMDSSGVTTLQSGVVTPENLSFTVDGSLVARLLIPASEVLTLFTIPITIVTAVAGAYIEVTSASAYHAFDTLAYTVNTEINLITQGANRRQFFNDEILLSTATTGLPFVEDITALSATDEVFRVNEPLQLTLTTGNSATGNSDVLVSVQYRLVTV